MKKRRLHPLCMGMVRVDDPPKKYRQKEHVKREKKKKKKGDESEQAPLHLIIAPPMYTLFFLVPILPPAR